MFKFLGKLANDKYLSMWWMTHDVTTCIYYIFGNGMPYCDRDTNVYIINWISNSSAWDLDELHLISKWKFLETLRLLDVPIKDGKFLVEVGKQCENLRTLRLTMKNDENWCYKEEFLQMLSQCKNLRDFSITGIVADTIHDFFRILFNSPQLRRFHTKTFTTNHFGWYYYGREIERLIRWCPNLTTFLIECPYMENTDYRIKLLDVER